MQATYAELAFYSISITGFMLLLITATAVMSILRLDRIEKLEQRRLAVIPAPAPNPPLASSASVIFQGIKPAPVNVLIGPDGRAGDQSSASHSATPAQPR